MTENENVNVSGNVNVNAGASEIAEVDMTEAEGATSVGETERGAVAPVKSTFFYETVDADRWAKIVCHAQYADLRLNTGDATKYKVGDIIVFSNMMVPSAKAVCRLTDVERFPGFSEAWGRVPVHGLGYIRSEARDARYTDFEWEYPMRKIVENGVIAIMWELISAEYIKKIVAKPKTAVTMAKRAIQSNGGKGAGQVATKPVIRSMGADIVEEPPVSEGINEAKVNAEAASTAQAVSKAREMAGMTDTSYIPQSPKELRPESEMEGTESVETTDGVDTSTLGMNDMGRPTAMAAAFKKAQEEAVKAASQEDGMKSAPSETDGEVQEVAIRG